MAQVQDLYPTLTEFETLLEDARMNAATDWDEQFVADLADKYERFGERTYLSDAQQIQLTRIANDD